METYTVVSWLVVIGGIALYVYYLSPKHPNSTDRNAKLQLVPEQALGLSGRKRPDKQGRRKADKTILQVDDDAPKHAEPVATVATNGQANNKKRKAGKSQPVQEHAPTPTSAPVREDGFEADADNDWIARLQANKEGVSFKPTSQQRGETGKPQNRKDKKVRNGIAGDAQTAEEFYAGTDADIISSGSPISQRMPSATDVSDMLEPARAGPTSLRITGEEKAKKTYTPKPTEPQETKKQRQNRRKAEEKKMLREEAEKERQSLLEKQRRSAREARGEPAKNGLVSAPNGNAWTAPAQQNQAVASVEGPLFDTFEHDGLSTASSNEINTNSTTPATNSSIYGHDLPSEEAQMEMLDELTGNSGWNEVSKSKKNKKKGSGSPPVENAGKENGAVQTPSATELPNASAKSSKPILNTNTKKASAVNGFSLLDDTSASGRIQSHPDDSEWTVA